ncbi:hypothetical protein KIW84_022150 [Lathyrus oleraceus]|uniref:DUF7745 domain-containing protein n=1 Tax=Pisum sativum TaxID=3888 RepID=A0A9D4YB11_PEA|nr:hypothetical protein KIW84_022150 [Pisum sativum]
MKETCKELETGIRVAKARKEALEVLISSLEQEEMDKEMSDVEQKNVMCSTCGCTAEALHLKKYEIEAYSVKKGGMFGLTSEFLIGKAIALAQADSIDAFESIFVLLIYGFALFPNIDDFVDVNAIRIFLIGNLVPTLLGDMYFFLHLRNSIRGGTIVGCVPLLYKWFILPLPQTPAFMENKQYLRWSQRLMSLTNDDIVWYDSGLSSLGIIDSCGEFSNVPLIGTQGGINYNPALARHQLGFPLRDKPNNTRLEALLY